MSPPKVVVVIPTYNEKDNVGPLTSEIMALGIPNLKIHFIDDRSPDGTSEEIQKIAIDNASVKLTTRPGKLGLGSAIMMGMQGALIDGADMIVTMDSDGQHPPDIIPKLIEPIGRGMDVVIASRKVAGGSSEGFSFRRKMTSRGADWLARTWLGLPVKDGTNNFKAYSRRAAEILVNTKDLPNEYSFEVISLYHLKNNGMKMLEVPAPFKLRKSGESKLGIRGILGFIWDVLTATGSAVSSLD
jgi:dolichol-phosphate mannosyltransferase